MGPKTKRCTSLDGTTEECEPLGRFPQSDFLKHVKYFILSCIECKLLWSIVDICLYLQPFMLWSCLSSTCLSLAWVILEWLYFNKKNIFLIKNKQQEPYTSSKQQERHIKRTVLKTL